jgi:hypothetical protein
MEQRPLRLGDIVDDYCPRERRITNHVIAALMGDNIKQTRCSTCDTEHVYKGARMPSRRSKKDDVAALETAVLASVNGTQLVARIDPQAAKPVDPASQDARAAGASNAETLSDGTALAASANGADSANGTGESTDPLPGGWMGHRTLIRATLPRNDSEPPPARPIPEFTMHQRQPRGGHAFRGGQGWGERGRGPRGNFAFGNGHPHERNGNGAGSGSGNANGNSENFGNGFGGSNGNQPRGGQPPGPGNGQGRPNGHRRHRHGKHRRPPR